MAKRDVNQLAADILKAVTGPTQDLSPAGRPTRAGLAAKRLKAQRKPKAATKGRERR